MRTGGLRMVFVAMTLVTALATSCTKGSGTPAVPVSPTPAGPPGAVTGLKASEARHWTANPSSWKVILSWHVPASGSPVDHYQVARNGRIVDLKDFATTYSDVKADPGTAYRYRVVAIAPGGQSGRAVSAVIKTREPSLADARFDGRYDTRFTPTSSDLGITQVLPVVLVFTAKCGRGPCDVGYQRVGREGSGTLKRSGAGYSGTVGAAFAFLSCRGTSIIESLSFALRVTKAGVVHGEWRAIAFDGTMAEDVSAANGCASAFTHWRVAGHSEA